MHLLVRLKLPQRRLNPQLHSRSEKSHWQYFSSPKENRFHSGCGRSSMAANSQPQAIEGGGGRSSRGSSSVSASSVTPGMTGRSPASTAALWYFLYLNQIGLNTIKTLHLAPTSSTKSIPFSHANIIYFAILMHFSHASITYFTLYYIPLRLALNFFYSPEMTNNQPSDGHTDQQNDQQQAHLNFRNFNNKWHFYRINPTMIAAQSDQQHDFSIIPQSQCYLNLI